MKKMMLVLLCMAVFVTLAVAQNPTYKSGSGIQGIDKLGAHQNGGRGCVGCHAPHSGARGNGGNAVAGGAVTDPETGNETLWGEDIGPLYNQTLTFAGGYQASFGAKFSGTPERMVTGVMYCLSCHDGNIAKGAMMQNASFEQAAGLLPTGVYGAGKIPTLLGNDGTAAGNYLNDHPIGPAANLGSLPIANYFALDANKTRLVKAATPNANYEQFITNYGAPLTVGARTGAGFVVESTMADQKAAYVVCTTCHTPHTMYTASAGSTNPIATYTSGVFPTYFFIAAPYNPGAPVSSGTQASSATQFCRQCHFTGAGGSNESAGIMNVTTAF
jgi:hypothetical protein